ncbi:toll/interleukin-1 receptor domain-containing protein [Streptomyces sp. NPDC005388]|uniref:toll/interleukin-1 receptor domain-containing protein n=1 Tax=Streptomyces sp. NPDC005388 TaxID=3156717 RepID=UPI0033A61AB5
MSHGGKGKDGCVDEALRLIEPRLVERGYDVFTDVEKLRAGDSWHDVLYEEMYLCDAAIVLLGPVTIAESQWVRREADVLMGRHIVRSLRTVLPVFLGTQDTQAARKRGFNALLMLQAELGNRKPLPEGGEVEQFVEWVVAEFAPVVEPVGDRPFHAWVKRVAAFLMTSRRNNFDTVTEAAAQLSCSHDEMLHVRAKVGAEMFLAHLILRAGSITREGSADSPLPRAVAALRAGLDGRQLEHLAEEILPGWVDPDDAVPFAPVSSAGETARRPVVLLHAYDEWTAGQHIRRALYNEPDSFQLGRLPDPQEMPVDERAPAEDLLDACLAALRKVFGVPPQMPLNEHTVQARERIRDYLVINAADWRLQDVATVVNTLHGWFSWLIVILLTPGGRAVEDELRSLELTRAVSVDLPVGAEQRAYSLKTRLDAAVQPAG